MTIQILSGLSIGKFDPNSTSGSDSGIINTIIVDKLPDVGISNTIYLVKNNNGENNSYDEYVWIEEDQKFELLGCTDVDLTYYDESITTLNAQVLEIQEKDKNAVYYSTAVHEGVTKKVILLNNYDSISGIDTQGNGHNLAMVSIYDVADFGSPRLHANINTKQIVTVNDTQAVVTDKLIPQILLESDSISISTKEMEDPTTKFKYNAYQLEAKYANENIWNEIPEAS